MRKTAFAISLTLMIPLPAIALPPSLVLDGYATLNRNGQLYRAEKGVRLYEGDGLSIPQRIQFMLPYGAATVTKRRGIVKFLLSRQEGCGIRVNIVYSGGIGANARPRSCYTSTIFFESLTTGVFFNPWVNSRGSLIPNTLIAQLLPFGTFGTGASFEVSDRGNTSILEVQSGMVEAKSANVAVSVPEGNGNITERDKPPGPPIALDAALGVANLRSVRDLNGVKVMGDISPLNTLEVQGKPYFLGEVIPYPVVANSLRVTVRNAMGDRTRVYTLPLPLRKS